jgi:predicted transcriptional regulator
MSTLARVTVTLPADLLASADSRAQRLDRSRSWVVAEALRGYLRAPVVRDPAVAYAAAAVADAGRQHLAADLRLAPAERLRRAEELRRLARSAQRPRVPRRQVIGFDTYEDFYEWKKARRVGA